MAGLRAVRRIELDNCSISSLELVGGEPRLQSWNDVGHLAGLVDRRTGDPRVE